MEREGKGFFKGDKGDTVRFNTYFKTASYLLTFSAFLSLILTGEMEPLYTVIIIIGLSAGLLHERVDFSLLSKGILILSVPFIAADFFLMSKDILYAFTHLIILVTVARLISLRTNSDYNQLFLLTFFNLLAASALTINFSFALTFTLYLVSATWALLLFHMKKEVEGREGAEIDRRALEDTVTLPFFLGIGGVAILSLLITLAIFFVLPRAGMGFFSARQGKVIKTTGFSDKVDFGQIGPVSVDPTIVMRVELPDIEKGMGSIYLRGSVLDSFNGVTWEKEGSRLASVSQDGTEFFLYKGGKNLVRQEIILDPLDSRVIFGMIRVVRISGRFPSLLTDASGSIYLPANPSSRFQYTAYSDITRPVASELDADRGSYPQDILDLYTKAPPFPDRVKELALTITRDTEGEYRKALAVETYLKKNYLYTLSPNRDSSLLPLDDFLFKSREGYCDHFSTAMALLLRESGIPSRLVTGYMTTEWNDLGRFYTVRQKNAHSWVEAYFPSHGWISFDPTPSITPQKEEFVSSALSRYVGYARLKWDRYIINFTIQDQVNAAKEAKRRSEVGRETVMRLIAMIKLKSGAALRPFAVSISAILIIYLSLKWRRRKGGQRYKPRNKRSVPFYQEMLLMLAKKGLVKPEGMTPREFACMVAEKRGSIYEGITVITEAFEKVKYGGITLSAVELQSINRILKEMGKE